MNKQMSYYLSLLKRKAVLGAIVGGVVLGIGVLGLIRFATANHDETHYHADFAVYINGVRQEFKGPQYYQEVSACEETTTPLGLAHLHDQNNHVIHVHGKVITWGFFFSNLGWSLNDSMLFDGKTAYADGQDGTLSFVLNGKPTRSIANEVIGDQDRLLVSYGNEDTAGLQKQYDQVPADAKKADETKDPATCQGPEQKDVWTQLRQAFFF